MVARAAALISKCGKPVFSQNKNFEKKINGIYGLYCIPGGILQTVAGCQPYLWLQLGL